MNVAPPALILVLAALAFSGCADPSGGTAVELGDGTQVELKQVDSSATKGAISGVVVDEAIRPLAAASLTLLGPQLTVQTDGSGLFTFEGLDPGLYTISANATGFLPAQTTAEVLAGETAKVRMVLPLDTTPKPYHVTLKFDGFVQVGSGLANEAVDLFVGEETGVFSCTCRFDFTAEMKPSTLIFEATWELTIGNPTAPADAYWTIYGPDGDNGTTYVSDGCTEPCYGVANGGEYGDARLDYYSYIWLEGAWIVYNQPFKVFITLFYNGEAPEGWSFVAGDL